MLALLSGECFVIDADKVTLQRALPGVAFVLLSALPLALIQQHVLFADLAKLEG
jgi:hypothetical protein